MIRFLLKNRRLKKENVDWNTYEAILKFREQAEKGAKRLGKLPEGIEVTSFHIEEMPVDWIKTTQGKEDKVILYFHGGGYVCGSCESHRGIVAKFVKVSSIPALLFGYRLAPENPYPAALDDSLKAYQWLIAQGTSPSDMVFIGDSGGGGLLLATLLALRDKGLPLPAGAVALSPVTDQTCSGESQRINQKKCLSPEGTGPAFGRHYAGTHDLKTPYISPLFGELQGLPPLLIYAGGDECLRDDSTRFAEKAKQAGADVTLRVGEGLFHCYPACAPLFPEATRAMEEISAFIKSKVEKP